MSRARDKSKKRKSLVHQIFERMESLKCMGESRHQAKKEYKELYPDKANRNKTVGIHSYQTYDNYKATMKDFTEYVKENYNVKNIDDITEAMGKDYIKHRANEGYSSSTYSKDMAAINKVMGFELDKKGCGVDNRSYKNISNNRELKEHHKKINMENYKDITTVIEGTGIRRSSVGTITKDNFNYNSSGELTSITVKEKGGKERTSNILESHRDSIREIIEAKSEGEVIFDKVPGRLPTHRSRQDYARGMYNEVVANGGGNGKAYRGYDEGAIREVSQQLGHKRLDVVVYNYLKPTEQIEETQQEELLLYDYGIDDVEHYY